MENDEQPPTHPTPPTHAEEEKNHEEGQHCCEERPQKGQVVVQPMPQ
jgi:hypothetical protein